MDTSQKNVQYAVAAFVCIGIAYYLRPTYFNKNKADKDEKDKKRNNSTNITEKKNVDDDKDNALHGTQSTNMNAKLAAIFLQASERAKEDFRKQAYKKVHLELKKLPFVIGSQFAPTGKQMGTRGPFKVPNIGPRSGAKIDEYLRTGKILKFEEEYNIKFNNAEVLRNFQDFSIVEPSSIFNKKEEKKQKRLLKHQNAIRYTKMLIAPGIVVDLETTIPRKGSLHSIFEIGAITTNYDKNENGSNTFNCMVDFDLEQREINTMKDVEERLEQLGQDSKFTLKFWRDHVLIPKFHWENRNLLAEKMVESRKAWNQIIDKYGNGREEKIPTTYDMMKKIKNEYGSYFFFPQKYALQTFLNFNLSISQAMNNTNSNSSVYWYAHNGNTFDFSVLEKSCWRLNIGLNVKRLVVIKGKETNDNNLLFEKHGIKPNRKAINGLEVMGFDTLQFARTKVAKGWATKKKRAGHNQESLYARYTSTSSHLDTKPENDGETLQVYDAHNAVDDCIALLKIMKCIDLYLENQN
jgi:hypothetical protein